MPNQHFAVFGMFHVEHLSDFAQVFHVEHFSVLSPGF